MILFFDKGKMIINQLDSGNTIGIADRKNFSSANLLFNRDYVAVQFVSDIMLEKAS